METNLKPLKINAAAAAKNLVAKQHDVNTMGSINYSQI
jgi:hypothetical protein